jgi:GT2 family glycosyltransferase
MAVRPDTDAGAGDPLNRLILEAETGAKPSADARHAAEAVIVSPGGGVMILGWVDDQARALDRVTIITSRWRVSFDAAVLARRVRPDVTEALGRGGLHAYGFMGFIFADREIVTDGGCEMHLRFVDGGTAFSALSLRAADDQELRMILLSHISETPRASVATPGLMASLTAGLGDEIIRFNRSLTAWITKAPYVERFCGPTRRYKGSIVVCLFGRPEYHYVQNALFAGGEGIQDYEFIFVSNSPELAGELLESARKSRRIHGLDQTLVLLPGNAGFGGANNRAVQYASSGRVLTLNPDVLPKDPAWARTHSDLIETKPEQETQLFGAALYYDDGSLMHGGMYFEPDTRVAFNHRTAERARLWRVEHFGKGAPADSPAFTRARPVPAVTGAFISADRPWFEQLGGFDEDYVFGHCEDADLCLKSLKAGTAAWIQDLRLWHLEGKGSTRLPAHDGGALVNGWLFASRWSAFIDDGLLGPRPAHPLLSEPAT